MVFPQFNTNWCIYSYLSLINLGGIPHWFLEEMGENTFKTEYNTSTKGHFDQI